MDSLAVIVTTPPNHHFTETAFQFIEQAIEQEINVIGVFFYQAGVLNASAHLTIPNDEFPLLPRWQQLANSTNLPLYLCSTAAEKHGLIDESQTQTKLIDSAFTMAGLGELVQLHTSAERVIQL
ncbi:sulfurtransferase complex subunit TusD [Thalassotalea sp. G2M2-11]|uniref:sulfurtransferase complex subunit TusD n=1 Tax=Thalassotalea sp. G2M2-11 TaxID=2787627 RepID=UPI0019D2882A